MAAVALTTAAVVAVTEDDPTLLTILTDAMDDEMSGDDGIAVQSLMQFHLVEAIVRVLLIVSPRCGVSAASLWNDVAAAMAVEPSWLQQPGRCVPGPKNVPEISETLGAYL